MNARSALVGSSPLTRGKQSVSGSVSISTRLIPAHAGKTIARPLCCACTQAHPRSRGENVPSAPSSSSIRGSSPLTRGKHPFRVARSARERLIPAHAGKTCTQGASQGASTAHPRSRGENAQCILSLAVISGSSPLTRGKLDAFHLARHVVRLIPAHAGKTRTRGSVHPSRGAHPRSRGENTIRPRTSTPRTGSSPLTRGKPGRHAINVHGVGLIPAHAGKTSLGNSGGGLFPAHPRSRGENAFSLVKLPLKAGSSPLTRGKPIVDLSEHPELRLIPAHAGKTWSRAIEAASLSAHPRSRRENMTVWGSNGVDVGSSPLTRGKHGDWEERRMRIRLIPAHAGKTRGAYG